MDERSELDAKANTGDVWEAVEEGVGVGEWKVLWMTILTLISKRRVTRVVLRAFGTKSGPKSGPKVEWDTAGTPAPPSGV
jgi:hypothetical protein